jgi:7-cyano-7-deazaguanine synthase
MTKAKKTTSKPTEKADKVMVVLSGGQDSTTCLYWAKANFQEVHAITFNYGQKHEIEVKAAYRIAKMAEIASHQFVTIPNLLKSRSPLVSHGEELEQYEDYATMDKIIGDRVELTFVPMRNAFFLTVAANYALEKDCYDLVTGVCQQDNANYPDCRQVFIDAQELAINTALGIDRFKIHTPLMDLSKAQSIALAKTLDGCMDALAYSHTAYDGKYPPTGRDHASVLRAQGFLEANTPDPLVVRAWKEGLMALPDTPNYKGLA